LRDRSTVARTSASRSLPKNMSVPPTNMVGEPKPPQRISSSVLARSLSLTACSPSPANRYAGSTPARVATRASTSSWEMSSSSPQYASNAARAKAVSLPSASSSRQPRIALTLLTGKTRGGNTIFNPAARAQSARSLRI
jgi:hypothetical protein